MKVDKQCSNCIYCIEQECTTSASYQDGTIVSEDYCCHAHELKE